MYLFNMKNGKKKLAYGESPEDALEILRIRLTDEEMDQIIKDEYVRIRQRDLQKYVDQLG
ncbi:MAG TPA: hypothetical protein ENI95_00995 [Chloroflexi bacterium]|nr:hypothetical protein [Chloroflexota bacterium]